MTVEITCPNCNFSKHIPRERIPAAVRWATCPRCKHRFEFALPETAFDFEQAPESPVAKAGTGRKGTAWERRSELGIWQGIYQTSKAALFSPENLFRTMAFTGGIKEPLAFGLLLGSIGTMFGFFWQFVIMAGGLAVIEKEILSQITMSLVFLGIIVISPLFVAITIFFISLILHLLLRIVRGGKNGFEATFRVVSYSQATQVLGFIPFIGGLIGVLWILIVQIIGLREIHETSYLKVFMALLIPLAVIFVGVMAVVITLFTFGSR